MTPTDCLDDPLSIPRLSATLAPENRDEPPLWRIVSDDDQIEELHQILGDFCHDVRNRLNSFHLCLYLCHPNGPPAEDPRWGQVEASYREVLHLIDLVQTVCRPMRLDLMPIGLELLMEDRVESWSRELSERGGRLVPRPPSKPAQGLLDPMRWTQALDVLVAWRASEAPPGTDFTIAWREGGGELALDWVESPTDREADHGPRRPRKGMGRSKPRSPRTEGSLALALLARVVHEHGGSIELANEPRFRVNLCWPGRVQDSEGPEEGAEGALGTQGSRLGRS